MKTIVHVASEVTPFSKTGGLADVVGSLPRALATAGLDVLVVSPLYPSVKKAAPDLDELTRIEIRSGASTVTARILETRRNSVRFLFVDDPEFFDRPGIYGDEHGDYPDNAARFLALINATLGTLTDLDIRTDVIHCHDWQTGPLPLLLDENRRALPQLARTRTVFTIHNLGYQGSFPKDTFEQLGIPGHYCSPEGMAQGNGISFLKAGLVYADRLTTVSPTYAREIQTSELGFGMEQVLQARSADLSGILNGIDVDYWNPATDDNLPTTYHHADLGAKERNRLELLKELALDPGDAPLFGIVSRLAGQKGIDLAINSIPDLVKAGAQVALLGTGEPKYHHALADLAAAHPGRVSATLAFSEPLAHRIYGGSDFFLMPSDYEPCGLGQMIALRYGTLPIATRTGGLADTIIDLDEHPDTGNGFLLEPRSEPGFADALQRALRLHEDSKRLNPVRVRGMTTDFSWGARAREYVRLYDRLTAAGQGSTRTPVTGY